MKQNKVNIETIHDRIAECVRCLGNGKNTVFAEKLGVSEGNIRGYIKGVLPKADVLEKIVRYCDISAEWLLTGNGEMLKTADTTPPVTRKETPQDKQNASNPVGSTDKAVLAPLMELIRDKDNIIREQAEEIGHLKARIYEMERRRGDYATDVTNVIAHAE